MKKVLALIFGVLFLLSCSPWGRAAEEPFQVDLSMLIASPQRRQFVEGMINYALRYDPAVKQTLEEGYTALFFFEGCSDNMDDEILSDISYYRVSAVCVALKLQPDGNPGVIYFNKNCSTLPDRPLEYGKWHLEQVGDVGPATVADGTYELYSVKHNGAYEALHIQTSLEDDTVAAVYMTPEGFVNAQANQINIHTRTGNHVIEKAMWSAGCLLVGDGDFGTFTELVQSAFYSRYDSYEKDLLVGTVTINRQYLKQELYDLYQSKDAVDMLLAASRRVLPEKYLARCGDEETMTQEKCLLGDGQMMTLPCSNATDPRSVPIKALKTGEIITVCARLDNSLGNEWYVTEVDGQTGYVYGGFLGPAPEEPEQKTPQEPGFWGKVLGWLRG